MISHPQNLAAWLDNELPEAEAALVTAHVEGCAECRAQARAYADVSASLAELVPVIVMRRRRWPRVVALVSAIAAAIVMAVALYPKRSAAPLPPPAIQTAETRVTARPDPQPLQPKPKILPRRRPVRRPVAPAYANGPVIRVALPADALFAPGAVPPGIEIYADVTLAADGSPRELRVLP